MLNVTAETDSGSSNGIGQEDFPAPIGKLLGLKLSIPADGQATVEFEATERYANPMGTLHGGVLCDVADAAMGAAYRSTVAEGESFTTLELISIFCDRMEGQAARRGQDGPCGPHRGLGGIRYLRRTAADGGARVQHLHDAARQTRRRSPATAESDVGDLKETARSDPSTRSTN
jgi:hypothetical protein